MAMTTNQEHWIPMAGDIAVPRKKAGYIVQVVDGFEDSVSFVQVTNGQPSDVMTNRLSTFLDRFELLERTKESA
jgi:hypothetical protein